ncbi:MAG: hypothetical protein CML03_13010 [Pseudooceanicola sp.]|nr:hypothetical protein [Pseudooceanicola sp.]
MNGEAKGIDRDGDETPDPAGAARLREEIDRGGTGDKVAFSDPAAAPLGTDAEAGGAPPTREQVERAAAMETGRAPEASNKPDPSDRLKPGPSPTRMLVAGGVLLAVLVIVALIFGAF